MKICRISGAGLMIHAHRIREVLSRNRLSRFLPAYGISAVQEREFYRIDHITTAGVLIHPNYDEEEANGVTVTTDILYRTEGSYYLNTQVGEDLVTNPEEASVPELLLDWFDAGKTKVMRRSNQTKGNILVRSIWRNFGVLASFITGLRIVWLPYEAEDFAVRWNSRLREKEHSVSSRLGRGFFE